MLKKAICKLTILSFIVIFSSSQLYSQKPEASPIMPYDANMVRDNLGVVFSLGQNWQSGNIIPECNSCLFNGGVGTGYSLGFYYDREIAHPLYWGIMANVDVLNFESRFIDIQSRPVNISDQEQIYFRLSFDQILETQLTVFGMMPHLTWRPFEFLTLRSGVNFAFPISSSFVHSEILTDRTVRYQNVIYEVDILEDSPVVQDSEIPDLNSMLYSWDIALSFPIEIFYHSYLVPGFSMSMPLNDISNSNPGFRINRWRIQLAYNYPLTAPPKQKPEQVPLY